MPKRKSKPRLDTVQNARRIVLQSVGEPENVIDAPPVSRSIVSQVMAEMGRRGGQIGGKRRLETMSTRQRTQIARKAAKARWAKAKAATTE